MLWDRAIHQNVPVLLYWRLKSLQPKPIPAHIEEKMKSMAIAKARVSLMQQYYLGKLLLAFQSHAIPMILLKGSYLREIVYQDISLRNIADVDILVQTADLERTLELLHDLGYSAQSAPLKVLLTSKDPLPYRSYTTVNVDIHWTIDQRRGVNRINETGLWQRAGEATVAKVKIKSLATEDLLLHLCLHNSSRHSFVMMLRSICDIQQVLIHFAPELDWQRVLERAREWNASRSLYLNLYLAQELLGAEIPQEVLEQIKPPDFSPEIEQTVLDRIFVEKSRPKDLTTPFARGTRSLSLGSAIHTFKEYVFPAPDKLARMFFVNPSKPKIYFFYPLRWADLIHRWGKTIWQLSFREKKTVASLKEAHEEIAEKDWLEQWLFPES